MKTRNKPATKAGKREVFGKIVMAKAKPARKIDNGDNGRGRGRGRNRNADGENGYVTRTGTVVNGPTPRRPTPPHSIPSAQQIHANIGTNNTLGGGCRHFHFHYLPPLIDTFVQLQLTLLC